MKSRGGKGKRGPKAAVKKAVAVARKQPLVKLIKKVIRRQAETKMANFQDGFEISPANIGVNNIQPLTPYALVGLSIGQGTGQGDRIGNRITVKSLVMRFIIFPLEYDILTNPNPTPQIVRIWFFSQKQSNVLLAANPPRFIQNGDTAASLTGTLIDMNRVINQDEYTYLAHRTYKIGYSNYGGTGTNVAAQSFTNNDYKLNIIGSINLTKLCPKIIKYDDTDNTPNSRLVMMLVQTVNADGSSTGSTDFKIGYNYDLTLKYNDF